MTQPLILPKKSDEKGVLDGTENRVTIILDTETGAYNFAIGKEISPFHLINMGHLLIRYADKMIDAMEAKNFQDALATAQVMNSLQRGRPPADPFRTGGKT